MRRPHMSLAPEPVGVSSSEDAGHLEHERRERQDLDEDEDRIELHEHTRTVVSLGGVCAVREGRGLVAVDDYLPTALHMPTGGSRSRL